MNAFRRRRRAAAGKRLAVWRFRRDRVQGHGHSARCEIRMARAHCGRARDDAVEVQRIALRHEHRFASAGRTADEVGMRRRLAIVGFDDLLREHRNAPVRDEFEVECGLLVLHEGAVESAAGALMSGVGGGDSETAYQRRLVSRGLRSGRLSNGAVQATAALLQKLAGPVIRKGDRETDAVCLAIRTCAFVHDAVDAAMCRQHGAGAAASTGGAACRHGAARVISRVRRGF